MGLWLIVVGIASRKLETAMIARRVTFVFASVLLLGSLQPQTAHAEAWSLFDWWAKPLPTAEWVQPAPVVAPAPRPQRVAVVTEVRRPPPRILVIGIGF